MSLYNSMNSFIGDEILSMNHTQSLYTLVLSW